MLTEVLKSHKGIHVDLYNIKYISLQPLKNDGFLNCLSGKQKVSFPEFLDILLNFKSKTKTNWKEEILAAFKAYDNSGKGYISMKDLRHIMLRTGEKLSPPECKCLLQYWLYC